MLLAPIPDNEAQRLESLQHYQLLDTPAEVEYDRVSQIASELCQTPIAMVSLIDKERQWVKSCYGITVDNIPRGISLCAHTITYDRPLMIENTSQDDRFFDNPAVTGPPNIVFYVGIPLVCADGFAIGSLCVIDHQPRQLTMAQQTALQALADQVVLLMELRRTNAQLRLAQQEAEDLARQKAGLLATLSHEIRTPLNALEGYTQLLLSEPMLPTQQDSLLRLQTIGRTTVSLVNNILDYSKLQAGKLTLEAIPFSLPDLLRQVVDMQTWQARQKNIALITEIDADIPGQLRGDAIRLLQVVQNLVSNALKFTHQGQVCVAATILGRTAADITLNIEVRDTGIGISTDGLASLFNEYTQVSASTTRLYGGTGLGLAITHQLVARMGGTLAVESQEGQGSRFYFSLTLPVVETSPALQTGAGDWTQGTVMGVDDSIFNTKVLARLIENQGGRIDVFNDPLEALEAARYKVYKHILLDLHMPNLDGYELAQLLKVLQPGVPLIALSADDSAETRERTEAVGFQGFLRKPFLADQIVHLLTTLG